MEQPKNPVGWFEIPTSDMIRAVKFYSHILELNLSERIYQMGEIEMCWLPSDHEAHGASGALVNHKMYVPSDTEGVLIYFSCEDVAKSLDLVTAAGGKVTMTKKLIAEDVGYMGIFIDSEGNRIAFHSRS